MENVEIKVESDITADYVTANSEKMGIRIIGGWLEKNKALEFAKKLLDSLME